MSTEETKKPTEKAKGCCYVVFKIVGYVLFGLFFVAFSMCTKHCAKTNMRSALKERSNPNTQLEVGLEKTQSELPKRIDEVSTVERVEMDNDYFYYITELDQVENTILELDQDSQKNMLIGMLKEKLPNMQQLITNLIKTDRGLVYLYSCRTSGISTKITLSVKELEKLIEDREY